MRIPRAFTIFFVAIGSGLVSAQAQAKRPAAPIIEISPTVPTDIPGGANNADITQAAIFAWEEFIAENWPAEPGTRDTPDTEAKFGDPAFDGPLVWHTHRHKVEIYPGQGTPPGFDASAADFGYSAVPPQYVYGPGIGAGANGGEGGGDGSVPPCPGQTPVETPSFINLDEISQIGLNQVFAGAAPSASPNNKDPQLIRFLAKGNKMHYLNAVDPSSTIPRGDPLYTHPQPCPTDSSGEGYNHTYCVAKRNFQAVAQGDGNPTVLLGPVVDFPSGTIMVKSAWRELTDREQARGKFYQTTVRYYEDNDDNPGTACYRESIWGLVSMHIIQKTPTAPYFIFATYEQEAILLTPSGRPVENANGRVVRRHLPAAATRPALFYEDGEDGTPPTLEIIPAGTEYCLEPGKRLFYQENPDKTGLPSDGNICQNYRFFDIPPAIRQVNRAAHRAIKAYNRKNGLKYSVWLNYRLTNVQWLPFDTTEVAESDPNRGLATYYLSDAAIETDYTLQQFSGRIDMTGPPTSVMPQNFFNFNGRKTYQNTLQFEDNELNETELIETSNMGGCMGCHGVAQLGGNQFSFILGGGRVAEPDAPGVTPPGSSNPTPIIPVVEPGGAGK